MCSPYNPLSAEVTAHNFFVCNVFVKMFLQPRWDCNWTCVFLCIQFLFERGHADGTTTAHQGAAFASSTKGFRHFTRCWSGTLDNDRRREEKNCDRPDNAEIVFVMFQIWAVVNSGSFFGTITKFFWHCPTDLRLSLSVRIRIFFLLLSVGT